MTENPTSNVYRDGEFLVVPIEGAVFPNRCVKTNAPLTVADHLFETDLLWGQVRIPESEGEQATKAIARALFGMEAGAVLDLARKKRLKFLIGLNKERHRAAVRNWRIGLALVILGPILAIALAGAAITITEKAWGEASLPWTIAGGSIGMILMIVGIVFFGIASLGLLNVMSSDGQRVWLSGASPEFLATLAESPIKWQRKKLFG